MELPYNRDMAKWKKLAHVVYQCSYHIVWTPKYRYRILEGEIAKRVEEKIRAICEWKDVEILELNVMKDHVHMVVSMPPRVSMYFVKPKSPKKSCKFPHQAMGIFAWSFCRISACFMR